MAIISCPECGKQVSDRAASCPECGCPISTAPVVPAQQNNTDVEQLFVLARRAREGSDSINAKKYYEQILSRLPGNWEAIFYTVYYEAIECKIAGISSAATSVANCIYSTFSAINDLDNEADKEQALNTVINSASYIARLLANGAYSHYSEYSTTTNAFSEYSGRVSAAANIYYEIETNLEAIFPGQQKLLADFRKTYVNFAKEYSVIIPSATVTRLNNRIAAFYPEYGEALRLESKKDDLESRINKLNQEINSIITERKATAKGCGTFFALIGGLMVLLGLALAGLDGGVWPIFVGAFELLIAIPFLKKTPSEEVIKANLAKKQQLIAERDALQLELNSLL